MENVLWYSCREHLDDEKERYSVKRIDKMMKKLRCQGYTLPETEVNFE